MNLDRIRAEQLASASFRPGAGNAHRQRRPPHTIIPCPFFRGAIFS